MPVVTYCTAVFRPSLRCRVVFKQFTCVIWDSSGAPPPNTHTGRELERCIHSQREDVSVGVASAYLSQVVSSASMTNPPGWSHQTLRLVRDMKVLDEVHERA